jgi:glycosyltransferase involved in cell wall biosynthesis
MQNINSEQPLISVIFPVWNAESYIEAAIKSILNQTIKNFELILIDDGSTDSSLKIMQRLSVTDNRILLIARENKGLIYTLNQGIHQAVGKWIARMDADDIAYENRLEKQLDYLHKTKADICGSWAELFGEQQRVVLKHAVSNNAIKTELLFCTPFVHPTIMIKAELAKSMLYQDDWKHCEDYDLWVRLAENGCKLVNVPEVLLKYRTHKNQVSILHLCKQQKLSQNVRKRYAKHYSEKNDLPLHEILELLKLRERNVQELDLDLIESAVNNLFSHSDDVEVKEVVKDHITRLLFRAAAHEEKIPKLWKRVLINQNIKPSQITYFQLYLISKFKLSPNTKSFIFLKKIFFSINKFR